MLSSRIEGTRISLTDVFLDEAGEGDESDASEADRQEARNDVAAMELGLERLREGQPITLNLVLDLHAALMAGVRGADKSPGGSGQSRTGSGAGCCGTPCTSRPSPNC